MKLFHGTNIDFEIIDLAKSQPYKDFGQGFYLTDIQEQAELLAAKKAKLYGGKPIVQIYDFDNDILDNNILNILKFDKPTSDWADFVFKNRNRKLAFRHEFDIVIGPIANDGVAYLLSRYEEGTLSISELSDLLTYKKLNSQFYFGTEKSLKYLHRI